MNILEYSIDVDKNIDDIFKLCDKLGIAYENQDSVLSDDDITLLDNEIANGEEEIDNSDSFDDELDEDLFDEKVEQIISDKKINIDNHQHKEKLKSKQDRIENGKNNFRSMRKEMYKHREKLQSNDTKDDNIVVYKSNMTVTDLATTLGISPLELIKKLMKLGIMANVNYSLSYDMAELLVIDYDKVLKTEENVDISNFENFDLVENEDDLITRPPVVTIMGHVDHGKTSLLDAIRKTDVVSGEAGGITQAIGAYQVELDGKKITFIDTPGHEAFTEMRARGASITDVVVIIVAANDGVMPQTKEAIDHAKAAKVPIIVAVNKIDLPDANVDRVLTDLVENGLTPEEWGGDIVVNKISAATGEGINELLENILLVAEMQEYKANPNRYATGTVVEARKDNKVGSIATLLIQNGTLRLGDPIVVGTSYGKVRTLKNDLGQNIVEAPPSTPVEVTGINDVPDAGDKFMAFESEKQAKSIAEERRLRAKEADSNFSGMSLDELFGKIQDGAKEIKVVLKADVHGSLEAVKSSLEKINVEGVKISVIRGAVGAITESDVVLASASDAIIIGFNVRANQKAQDNAKRFGVEIRTYDIIYKVVEDMEAAMKGMLDPEYEEKVTGTLEIRQIFKFSKVGLIAGCHVTSGVVKNNEKARIIRDGVVVYNGAINTLQHEKDQVKEVKKGMDCGITLENCQDYKEGDVVEIYDLVEVKR